MHQRNLFDTQLDAAKDDIELLRLTLRSEQQVCTIPYFAVFPVLLIFLRITLFRSVYSFKPSQNISYLTELMRQERTSANTFGPYV